jgi:hypothetical protein
MLLKGKIKINQNSESVMISITNNQRLRFWHHEETFRIVATFS